MQYDVTQHGLVGDGLTSNNEALTALLNSVPDGSVLYFPSGIYADLYDHRIANRARFTFCGDGAASVLQRRGNPTGGFATFTACQDITIRDLAFDAHGCAEFGGVQVVGGSRWRVERCRFFDGNLIPPTNKDRYSLLFSSAAPNCDLWITDCLIEDQQLDLRNCQRVQVRGNTILRSPVTGGIEIVSLGSNMLIEDILIESNLIQDAWGAGIGVTLDNAADANVIMRRIKVVNNLILLGTQTKRGIYLGTNNSSIASGGGCVFSDFDVSGNTVVVRDGITRVFDSLIFGNNSVAAAITCSGWRVAGNRIRGNGTGYGVDVRKQTLPDVSGNHITNTQYAVNVGLV